MFPGSLPAKLWTSVHPSGNGAAKQQGLVNVALADLAPTPTPQFIPGSGYSIPQLELFTLDRVFAQLRKRLLGHGEADQAFKPLTMGKRRRIEVEDDDNNPPENVKRFDDALFGFAHEMRHLIDSPTIASKDVRGLYVIWFEVVMNMLLARRGDIGEAKQFMREWSAKVGHSMKATSDIDALEQHFVTCTATTSIQGDGIDLKTVMHEWLENYYDGEVDEKRARNALLPPIGIPFGILLAQVTDPERVLTDSLSSVIASKTIRQYVLQAGIGSRSRQQRSRPGYTHTIRIHFLWLDDEESIRLTPVRSEFGQKLVRRDACRRSQIQLLPDLLTDCAGNTRSGRQAGLVLVDFQGV